MNINDLLDLTLREILDEYCVVHNLECGFFYGIFKWADVNRIYNEYNVDSDYPEAFCPESVIVSDELIDDCDNDVKDYDKLIRIMENLGITKKESVS